MYSNWKYETFSILDGEGDYYVSDGVSTDVLDDRLREIITEYINSTDTDTYYQKITDEFHKQTHIMQYQLWKSSRLWLTIKHDN